MKGKSIFIGTYRNMDIYYNKDLKRIERSGNKKLAVNQSILVGLILVTIPLLKAVSSGLETMGILSRIIGLIICTILGVLSGFVLIRKLDEQVHLVPMEMDKDQFEDFYRENKGKLKGVKWVLVASVLPLFLEAYLYISWGIFVAVFAFLLNAQVVTLLFLGGLPYRQEIFKEIERSYMGDCKG